MMRRRRLLGVEIAGLGHYAPERIVTNDEIEARLGLARGFIADRTGILERRWASEGEALSDLAVAAGRMALADAGLPAADIALVVLATSTPDHLLPPSCPLVAHRLGLSRAGAIDMAGACAGFLYALTFAEAFVRTRGKPAMVIAANVLSRRINPAERASAILFADAAGAVVLQPSRRAEAGIQAVDLASDGAAYGLIHIPAGGSRTPFRAGLAPADTLMAIEDGKAVFQKAVAMMVRSSRAVLDEAQLDAAGIAHFVPHQANMRIIEATRSRLGFTPAQTLTSVAHYANSSAATIAFTLSLQKAARTYAPGDHMLLCAAGAGLTGGAVLYTL
ncbi:MAG: beta-ketoacyl-ACP synthase III [Hyphomicrobiaceae bacterium]|nr:beta-ketoacyl-ACP synthase III [Hyphomicrobiaceae bacterium]